MPRRRPTLVTAALLTLLTLLVVGTAGLLPLAPAFAGPAGAEPMGVWPLVPEPDVVRHFEPPPNPYASGHRGVDLAGHAGQDVHAALDGTVGFAGSIGGKPVVTVVHGDRRTTYEPVVATVVRGQPVSAGDSLGRLVVTDSHCFPAACLHWGLIRGEDYLDPLSLVGSGPVRLLPLWRDEPVTLDRNPWTPTLEVWRRPVDWLV